MRKITTFVDGLYDYLWRRRALNRVFERRRRTGTDPGFDRKPTPTRSSDVEDTSPDKKAGLGENH